MSKKKRRSSPINSTIQKTKHGVIERRFNTRTPQERSRALALRKTRMRLLDPLAYIKRNIAMAAIHSNSPMNKPKFIKPTNNLLTDPVKKTIVISNRKTPCQAKAQRRAVLLAHGKVQKPGGAPGPYKPRTGVKCA